MDADGLDIAFLDKVNRELSTIYAVVLLSAVLDGVAIGAVLRIWLDLPWPLTALAGVATFVLTLALLRATLLRVAARQRAAAVSANAHATAVATSALLSHARANGLTFVEDLVQRHGATGFDQRNSEHTPSASA